MEHASFRALLLVLIAIVPCLFPAAILELAPPLLDAGQGGRRVGVRGWLASRSMENKMLVQLPIIVLASILWL
jgi:hypothetical protein